MSKIVIVQGHPDPAQGHLCNALADAYAAGAEAGHHEVKRVEVAQLDFPLLRVPQDYQDTDVPDALRPAREAILWCDHMVVLYPLWLGTMPALLKGFFEQALRPKDTFEESDGTDWPKAKLKGKSARIVVTMGMPALMYRWFFFAHGLKNLERNILKFIGFKPVRHTLFGLVEAVSDDTRKDWLDKMETLGRGAL